MAGIIEVKDQGKLRIYDADNSHYTDIVVPSSVTANRTITLPDASFTVPTSGGVTGITSSANATAMTITSAEKIGIGTSSPVTTLDVGGSLSGGQGVVGKEMLVSQTLNTAYNGGTSGSWGGLMLNNNNSSTSVRTATGLHFTHGTSGVAGIVSTSTTSQRADIRFITRGAGDAIADRVIIHDDGVMSASQGVALGVGTANTASNVLDDYEEGTWTLAVTGQGSDSGQVSRYTKIGSRVFIDSFFTCDTDVSATNASQPMQGLPFNAGTSTRAIINLKLIKTSAVAGYGGAPTLGASSAISAETYGLNFIIRPISTTETNTSLYYRQDIFRAGSLIRLSGVYETTA